ncbi:ABC transporter [Streptomyces yokosukanensis]|uniref:Transport permease protein n=2 Tax=Streptomyces yokosukanensis TaxID=67386 RepID=A0A101P4V7_9ACTN|nr:ABC transporter [Streptomyces yokosukanensis]
MRASRTPRRSDQPGWFSDVLGLVVLDLRQFFDNRLFAVSTFLTSVSMVLAFGAATDQMASPSRGAANYFGFVFPGILAAGIMFSCTYTVGYTIIIDRNRRTIEDLILSPLSYSGFLLARFVGVVVKCFFQFALVLVLGVVVFDAKIDSTALLVLSFVSGCMTFAGLGTFIATYTNEVSFPAVVNIIVIPLMYFAGVFFPLQNLGTLGKVLAKLPLSVHVEVFRAATGQGPSPSALTLSLTVAYALLTVGVAAFAFRRRIGHG